MKSAVSPLRSSVLSLTALGRVEEIVDDALAHTGFDGGAVAGISVNRIEGLWPTVMVESPPSRVLQPAGAGTGIRDQAD